MCHKVVKNILRAQSVKNFNDQIMLVQFISKTRKEDVSLRNVAINWRMFRFSYLFLIKRFLYTVQMSPES